MLKLFKVVQCIAREVNKEDTVFEIFELHLTSRLVASTGEPRDDDASTKYAIFQGQIFVRCVIKRQ